MNDSIKPALSVAINQLLYESQAKGTDVCALSLGEAFFHLPLLSFRSIDFERGFHYSDSRGTRELRTVIARHYFESYGVEVDPDKQVLVTAGSKIAIFMLIKSLIASGDIVSVFEPAWVSYREQILLAGGAPEFLPFESSFSEGLELNPRTKVLILNNPNNPSGRNYSTEELLRILDACRAVGATLLVDEAYSDFVPGSLFQSSRELGEDVVVVNSLSKNLGMSGWRLGYVIGPGKLIDRLLRIQQNLITCAPTILQLYVAKYLTRLLRQTKPQIKAVINRRRAVKEFLDSFGISCLDGDSTFYLFASAEDFGVKGNVVDFCIHALINHGVSVVPGVAYGERTAKYIRISVGVEPLERIQEGILALISSASAVPSRESLLHRQNELKLESRDWTEW